MSLLIALAVLGLWFVARRRQSGPPRSSVVLDIGSKTTLSVLVPHRLFSESRFPPFGPMLQVSRAMAADHDAVLRPTSDDRGGCWPTPRLALRLTLKCALPFRSRLLPTAAR